MATPGHQCTITSVYGILGLCSCGQAWTQASPWFRNSRLASPQLIDRLKAYLDDIRSGRAENLVDAVRKDAEYRASCRAAEHATARDNWERRQRAKEAKWLRVMRAMLIVSPCAYCGGVAESVDHIVPRVRGGTHERRNLAPACMHCNIAKGGRTPEEWKAARLKKRQPWPPPWGREAA